MHYQNRAEVLLQKIDSIHHHSENNKFNAHSLAKQQILQLQQFTIQSQLLLEKQSQLIDEKFLEALELKEEFKEKSKQCLNETKIKLVESRNSSSKQLDSFGEQLIYKLNKLCQKGKADTLTRQLTPQNPQINLQDNILKIKEDIHRQSNKAASQHSFLIQEIAERVEQLKRLVENQRIAARQTQEQLLNRLNLTIQSTRNSVLQLSKQRQLHRTKIQTLVSQVCRGIKEQKKSFN